MCCECWSVPCEHGVVRFLLFLLVLLTHVQGCQVDAQQLSDSLSAVDVPVLVQHLDRDVQSKTVHTQSVHVPHPSDTHLSLHKLVPVVVGEGAVTGDTRSDQLKILTFLKHFCLHTACSGLADPTGP